MMNKYISVKDAEFRPGYVEKYARTLLKGVVAPYAVFKWFKSKYSG